MRSAIAKPSIRVPRAARARFRPYPPGFRDALNDVGGPGVPFRFPSKRPRCGGVTITEARLSRKALGLRQASRVPLRGEGVLCPPAREHIHPRAEPKGPPDRTMISATVSPCAQGTARRPRSSSLPRLATTHRSPPRATQPYARASLVDGRKRSDTGKNSRTKPPPAAPRRQPNQAG